VLDYIDFAVVREDYQLTKPAPDSYLAALERAGLAATDCIAVEDSPRGIAAARAAGLDCIFFTPGNTGARPGVGEVHARAASPEELETALHRWLST
jgi:beta-phosphoglucomutase-like phosphatase (HAD superfamily)